MVSIMAQGLEEHEPENALKEWVRRQLQKARTCALKLVYTGVLGVPVCFKFKSVYLHSSNEQRTNRSVIIKDFLTPWAEYIECRLLWRFGQK